MECEKKITNKAGLVDKIKQAVRSGNKLQLKQALTEANNQLTGRPLPYTEKGVDSLDCALDTILKGVKLSNPDSAIYLGDGGLSRVLISNDEGDVNVSISPLSTDPVKQKWQELK